MTNEQLAEILLGTMQQADRFKMKLAAAGFEIVSKDATTQYVTIPADSAIVARSDLRSMADDLGRLANRLYDIADGG